MSQDAAKMWGTKWGNIREAGSVTLSNQALLIIQLAVGSADVQQFHCGDVLSWQQVAVLSVMKACFLYFFLGCIFSIGSRTCISAVSPSDCSVHLLVLRCNRGVKSPVEIYSMGLSHWLTAVFSAAHILKLNYDTYETEQSLGGCGCQPEHPCSLCQSVQGRGAQVGDIVAHL